MPRTDKVLGAPHCGEQCIGAHRGGRSLLMEYSGSSEDLARTIHAHPTMSRSGEGGRAGRRWPDV